MLLSCESTQIKNYKFCKILNISVIDSEKDTVIDGLQNLSPDAEINLQKLPTKKIVFLINLEPENCASKINVKAFSENGGGSISDMVNRKPFVFGGIVKNNIFNKTPDYIAGEWKPGNGRYELTPYYYSDEGEKAGSPFIQNIKLSDTENEILH